MSLTSKYPKAFVTEEDFEIARTIHEFVDRKVMPQRQNLDGGLKRDEMLAKNTFDELAEELVKLDVQKAYLPEEIGGLGFTSSVTGCIMSEEIARGDVGLALQMAIVPWVFGPAIKTQNEAVLEDLAAPFCGDEIHIACYALTESAGGCNIEDPSQHGSTINTRAELDGDEWVINGEKMWASGAGISDVYLTVCTTDPKKGDEGIVLLCVPSGAEGLSFGKPEQKMGLVFTDVNAPIYYRDVRVPKEYCVGNPGGEGASLMYESVVEGRAADAGTGLGPAQAAFEILLEYTGNRYIKGKPVRERSMHASIIGEIAMKLQVSRYNYLTTAHMLDQPEVYGAVSSPGQMGRASASKVFSTRTAMEVIQKTMELMGSYGTSLEFNVEKYYRDIMQVHLWLGGEQLALLDSARRYYYFEW